MNIRVLFFAVLMAHSFVSAVDHIIGDGTWLAKLDDPGRRDNMPDEDGLQSLYQETAEYERRRDLSDIQKRDKIIRQLWQMHAPKDQIFRVVKKYGISGMAENGDARLQAVARQYARLSERTQQKLPMPDNMQDFLERRARHSYRQVVPWWIRLFRMPTKTHASIFGASAVVGGIGRYFLSKIDTKLEQINEHIPAAERAVVQGFGYTNEKQLKERLKNGTLTKREEEIVKPYLRYKADQRRLMLRWYLAFAALSAGSLGVAGSLFGHIRRDQVDSWRDAVKNATVVGVQMPQQPPLSPVS